jgi:hypothetical protein
VLVPTVFAAERFTLRAELARREKPSCSLARRHIRQTHCDQLFEPNLHFFHLFRTSFCITAIVTGSSDGIGREFALQLAAKKLNIVLAARRLEKLEAVAKECKAKGVEAKIVVCDFSDLER